MRRSVAVWVAAVAVLASACGTATPTSTGVHGTRSATAPSLAVGRSAWVAVSVATLWHAPDSPRPVDAPALQNPARIRTWLDAMTTAQRRGLGGRADTQALLGDRVVVLALPSEHPAWARVAVPSQPSPLDTRGYPGWVPRRQLSASGPGIATDQATVVTRTTWLETDETSPVRVYRLSLGTTLPLVARAGGDVRVRLPGGAVRRLAAAAVSVHPTGRPALPPVRDGVVATAKRFLGLPYLWAGASGFGVDCSGLTWLAYRIHGLRVPRDAAPQSRHGRVVSALRKGDLLFYAVSGVVHHVSMYVGAGRMIHSPSTGHVVATVPVGAQPLASQYAGARRYLP